MLGNGRVLRRCEFSELFESIESACFGNSFSTSKVELVADEFSSFLSAFLKNVLISLLPLGGEENFPWLILLDFLPLPLCLVPFRLRCFREFQIV